MKKILRFLLILMVLPLISNSQVLDPLTPPDDILDGAFDKEHNQQKEEAFEYPEISEKDIVWSRTIWREIDLRQKINHHFYYPSISDRSHLNPENMSLIDVIMESIQVGGILYNSTLRVFRAEQNAKPGKEFAYGELSEQEKLDLGRGQSITDQKFDKLGQPILDEFGAFTFETIQGKAFDRTQVQIWKIKEEWFFDKHRSTMDVRIIGLCPVQYVEEEGSIIPRDMFWIYFPDFRNTLVKTKVSNFTKNNAQKRSFLGVFEKRMFASRILQESNIMNRSVTAYMVGLDALLESERIKSEIFNIEQDMWEY